jgi:hypothetical protein
MPTAAAATADAAPRPVSPESGRANGVAVVAEVTWEGRVSPAEATRSSGALPSPASANSRSAFCHRADDAEIGCCIRAALQARIHPCG